MDPLLPTDVDLDKVIEQLLEGISSVAYPDSPRLSSRETSRSHRVGNQIPVYKV